MQYKFIIGIISILFSLVNCEYLELSTEFQGNFNQNSLQDWSTNKNFQGGFISQCDGQNIVGGYDKFSLSTELYKTFENIPSHDEIKVTLDIWILDNWNNGSDMLEILINDEQIVYTFEEGQQGQQSICGNSRYNDLKKSIQFSFPHTENSFKITFKGNLRQHPQFQSWGISNLNIMYKCSKIGDKCFSQIEIQRCNDVLGNLDGSETNNKSIKSSSNVRNDSQNQIVFDVKIQYLPPYKHDSFCLDQRLKIQNKIVQNTQFDEESQILQASFKLQDLQPKYNCQIIENSQKIIYLCSMKLDILFARHEQLTYIFQLQAAANKNVQASVPYTYIQNVNYIEDCCTNAQNIQSEILICKTYECNEFIDNPQNDSQDLFILHRVVTEEYKNSYYLEGISLKIGDIFPKIIKKDASQPGKTRYHFENIMNEGSQPIEIISGMSQDSLTFRRRVLSLDRDYKIKTVQQVQFLDSQPKDVQTQQQQKEQNQDNKNKEENQEENIEYVKADQYLQNLEKYLVFMFVVVLFGLVSSVVIVSKIFVKKSIEQVDLILNSEEFPRHLNINYNDVQINNNLINPQFQQQQQKQQQQNQQYQSNNFNNLQVKQTYNPDQRQLQQQTLQQQQQYGNNIVVYQENNQQNNQPGIQQQQQIQWSLEESFN